MKRLARDEARRIPVNSTMQKRLRSAQPPLLFEFGHADTPPKPGPNRLAFLKTQSKETKNAGSVVRLFANCLEFLLVDSSGTGTVQVSLFVAAVA